MRYTVRQGDRWDTIAYKFYGNPYLYEPIIRANPHLIGEPVPPPGTRIEIPLIEVENETEVEVPWITD